MSQYTFFPVTNEESEATMLVEGVIAQFNHLQGKVLTVVDAAIVEPQQNKAIKDLVKKAFYDQMDYVVELARGPRLSSGSNEIHEKRLMETSDKLPFGVVQIDRNQIEE